MRLSAIVILASFVLAGCDPGSAPEQKAAPLAPEARLSASGWSLRVGPADAALILADEAHRPVIRIACTRLAALEVTVHAFTPVGSEERLSFGTADETVTLVASVGGGGRHGGVTGVTGEGPLPDDLKQSITAPLSSSYGAQTSGPHAPPTDAMAGPFLRRCAEFQAAGRVEAGKPTPGTSPCLVQDGQLLNLPPMRALGTEPFWNARTDGRCVTYSTPENQRGTRLWTRVESGPMGPVWVGNYLGKPFVLRVQPKRGCSDGMSDNRYEWEATLTVGGDQRQGCAERP